MKIKINKQLSVSELDVHKIVEQAMDLFPPPALTEEEISRLAELKIKILASEKAIPAQFFHWRWEIEIFIWKKEREEQIEQLRADLAHELFHVWEKLRGCKYRWPLGEPWPLYYLSSQNEFAALYFETFFAASSITALFDWLWTWARHNGYEELFERRLSEVQALFEFEGGRDEITSELL